MNKDKKTISTSYSYLGLKFVQREDGIELFMFCAYPKEILKWSGIKRIKETPKGIQRVLKEQKKRSITKFFKSNGKNIIPTSVLLAFENENEVKFEKVEFIKNENLDTVNLIGEFGKIEFSVKNDCKEEDLPALIVDGQHRLNGMADFEGPSLPIVVVAMLNANSTEQAFQFVVINNKSTKVRTDNVKSIIAEFEEEELQNRILAAGIKYGKTSPLLLALDKDEESPFYNMLKWELNRTGKHIIPLTALEQAARYINISFPNLENDEDTLQSILYSLWNTVKNNYLEDWNKDFTLLKKVCLNALNEVMVDKLKQAWEFDILDIYDSKDVESFIAKSVSDKIPIEFWKETWSFPIQDNANIRNYLKKDIERIIFNNKTNLPWHDELKALKK